MVGIEFVQSRVVAFLDQILESFLNSTMALSTSPVPIRLYPVITPEQFEEQRLEKEDLQRELDELRKQEDPTEIARALIDFILGGKEKEPFLHRPEAEQRPKKTCIIL